MKQFDITNHEKPEWPNQETHSLHTREYRSQWFNHLQILHPWNPNKPTGLHHLLWPWQHVECRHWEHHWVQCLHCQTTRTCQLLGFFLQMDWCCHGGWTFWLDKERRGHVVGERKWCLHHPGSIGCFILFIFLWVLNSIHFCWCHVVLRLCYALLLSKSSLW